MSPGRRGGSADPAHRRPAATGIAALPQPGPGSPVVSQRERRVGHVGGHQPCAVIREAQLLHGGFAVQEDGDVLRGSYRCGVTWGECSSLVLGRSYSRGVALCGLLHDPLTPGFHMRAFPVVLPSGTRYWTVLDDDLLVVPVADSWGRYQRFGRSRAELTTKTNAGGAALHLRWCGATGRDWRKAARDLGLFIVWLKHTPSRADDDGPVVVRSGPGGTPVRRERRINVVLSATRGFLSYAVSIAESPRSVLGQLYELGDSRDLPAEAQGEDSDLFHRLRARHAFRSQRPRSTGLPTRRSSACSWSAAAPVIGLSCCCWGEWVFGAGKQRASIGPLPHAGGLACPRM